MLELTGREQRGAIILAGGDSKRLGRPKPLLRLNGVTLIERVLEKLSPCFGRITVVTDRPDLFTGLPVQLTGDLLTGHSKSPLRGIHAGLSASDLPYQFVVACDMPFINPALVEYMARFAVHYDAVVPRIGDYYQPLHAFYRRSCLDQIRRQVEQKECKVTAFYNRSKVRFIGSKEIDQFDPRQESFFNINTWSDYAEAEKILATTQERRQQ